MKVVDTKALKLWDERVKALQKDTPIDPFETKEEQQKRIKRAKTDYKYFIEYYLPEFATTETPDFHIKTANRVKRNEEFFCWLKWGRGLAKSVVADVTIPLWLWINDDIKFMVLIGQNETKASILLDDLKVQFEGNQRLIHDFGVQKSIGNWETGFFKTQNGFIAKSLGKGQDPRGLRVGGIRPDFISCDDWEDQFTARNPKRQREDAKWLLTSVIPIIDGPVQRVLLAQNEFAPEMTFSIVVTENKGWTVIEQKAYDSVTLKPYWPEKYADDYYKKKIKISGTINCNAEYNNDPHIEGKIFTDDLIQWAPIPRLNHFDAIIGKWDVAFAGTPTSDFNAVRVWGVKDGNKYMIDCFVKQSKLYAALLWIAHFQVNLPKSVSIPFQFEAQFWNEEIYRTIEEVEEEIAKEYGLVNFKLNLGKHDRNPKQKYARMLEMHPQYQNGRVYYNIKLKSHNDTKTGLFQLKSLEPGYSTKDDAPDADKEAFDYLDRFKKKSKTKSKMSTREVRGY